VERVVNQMVRDWEWILAFCRVEFSHGDLHLANAAWPTPLSDPDSRALLFDWAPYAMA
jgi:hypothetical protein